MDSLCSKVAAINSSSLDTFGDRGSVCGGRSTADLLQRRQIHYICVVDITFGACWIAFGLAGVLASTSALAALAVFNLCVPGH